MEDQDREPEDPERVLGPQLTAVDVVVDVDVELLGEALDGQGGEVAGGRVDVGQVMAGVAEVALGREGQPAAGPGPWAGGWR